MFTEKFAGDWTVTLVLAESLSVEICAVYAPASPLPVPTESVSVVVAPLASVTCVESLPSPLTDRSTVCVPCTSPTFSTVASTVSVAPSVTGEFVESMRTEKFAGDWTVTPVLAESLSEETVAVYVPASPSAVPTESVSVVVAPLASVTCVESLPSPLTDRSTVCVPCRSPTFSIVASTVSVSPSTTGEFVASIRTEKFAGSWTVTPVLAESFSDETVAVYVPASPLPVPTENVSVVVAPLASVTCVESLPSPLTVRSTVWVPLRSPTFSTVASTVSVSPSTTGEFVEPMLTEKFAGSWTVTPVLAESFSDETVAVYVPASPLSVPTENVSVVELPPSSVTDVESVPRLPAEKSMVCVPCRSPVFVIVASTVSVSPSTTGAFVESILTEKSACLGIERVASLNAFML